MSLLLLLLLVLASLCSLISGTYENNNSECTPSCGNIKISSPFRLSGDPPNCGDKSFELFCEGEGEGEEGNDTVLYLFSGKYLVVAINYSDFTIRVVDAYAALHNNINHNPFSNPLYSLTEFNFTGLDNILDDPFYPGYPFYPDYYSVPIIFVSCERPMNASSSDTINIVEAAPCLGDRSSYSYIMVPRFDAHSGLTASDLGESCKITLMYMLSPSTNDQYVMRNTCQGIYDEMAKGIQLTWFRYACKVGCPSVDDDCRINNNGSGISCSPITLEKEKERRWYMKIIKSVSQKLEDLIDPIYEHFNLDRYFPLFKDGLYRHQLRVCSVVYTVLYSSAKFSLGFPCIAAFLIYKWRRRHLSMYDDIEDFLQTNNNFMPVRYSYSDMKKMARGFKDKLGEGGYGSVYKGKLRSGRLVAVKTLSKSKANGQDFINEVATLGRIHHVNVVRLIGFCVEGSKRALVYDFMPNGSLEKYIFSKQGVSLSCEKIYDIAVEVARGIEYLHQGCDMQILHFDIKPHNILLDENFTAKISDFGLARLYPLDNSIVPLTAARGTMGYIAPEVCYKNFGGVSYKADVYSFGMLLMEMAGRRKNLNANVDVDRESQLSQVYYPSWVFDRLNEGKELQMEDATEEEKKITKKMIMVALWCIQMKPNERPSMNKVVEMLEGEMESLQMPPKPFLYPQQMTVDAQVGNPNPTCASVASDSTEITSN